MYWDKYESREKAISRRNTENAKIKTLTAEQHDVISTICKIRHDIHSDQEALFYTEGADHQRYWDYISGEATGISGLDAMLEVVGLPKMGLLIDGTSYPYDCDWDMTHDSQEEALTDIMEMAEEVNTVIENYLTEIDKAHGTNYAPTGIARLYM